MSKTKKIKAIDLDKMVEHIVTEIDNDCEIYVYEEEPYLDVTSYDKDEWSVCLVKEIMKRDRLSEILYDIIEDYKDDYLIEYKIKGELK